MQDPPIVVIGSGIAGYSTVMKVHALNPKQNVVQITAQPGDWCYKPNLSTALAQNKSFDDLILRNVTALKKNSHLKIIDSTGVDEVDADEKWVLANDERISYQKLVLAVGAQVRPLFLENDKVFSVNHLDDYRVFRDALQKVKNVLIVGSGLVGCEFANDLLQSNFKVQMISLESYPLASMVPPKIGEALLSKLQRHGLVWHGNQTIKSVDSIADQVLVHTDDDDICADLILSAIGVVPDLNLAQAADLTVQHGIVVDECLRTSNEHIFALGDCAQYPQGMMPYVAPITHAASALAKTLCGDDTPVNFPIMAVKIKTTLYPITIYGSMYDHDKIDVFEDEQGMEIVYFKDNQITGAVYTDKKSQHAQRRFSASSS